MSQKTPEADGFFMPAEWERHARTWMAWPCRKELWLHKLDDAREAYAEVARTIAQFEPVTMIARPEDVAEVSLMCGRGVSTLSVEHDNSWLRDNGPTFVIDAEGNTAGINWGFNGWGQKYTPFEKDTEVAVRILEQSHLASYQAPLIMEGGSFHTDGQGTLLVTEQCLLNHNRNPHLTKPEIEAILKDYLGVLKIIWLGQGLEDDETDGHIDNLACFVKPGLVLLNGSQDPQNPHHAIMKDAQQRLGKTTDAKGRPLDVVVLEEPMARHTSTGERMTLSYINFYICNNAIILPSFEDANDQNAYEFMTKLFPEREIMQVPALDILTRGGGIHCITQQQPQGLSVKSG